MKTLKTLILLLSLTLLTACSGLRSNAQLPIVAKLTPIQVTTNSEGGFDRYNAQKVLNRAREQKLIIGFYESMVKLVNKVNER